MSIITRRAVASGIAALGAGALLPRLARADLAALEAAARKEGTLTWYMAQVDSESAEALGRAFTAQYPGISVAVIRTTGQVAYQRLLLDLKNNAPQCDVFSTTDIAHMPALKERNALAHYVPEDAAGLLPQFKSLSDDGYYYVTGATNHFLVYNTDKVHADAAPRSWTDLLDPKWKNQIALPHPAFSGCAGVWALGLRKLYGWDYFDKLAKNNPRIGRSFGDPITLLTAGECEVGPGPALQCISGDREGQSDRRRLSQRRLQHLCHAVGGAGQCAASQCGPAVPGMDAQRHVFPAVRRARQRSAACRAGAEAGPQDDRSGQGDRAQRGGNSQGRAGGDRILARHVRQLSRAGQSTAAQA